jgi:hypothetical protein
MNPTMLMIMLFVCLTTNMSICCVNGYSYSPPCSSCKWFIPNKKSTPANDYDLCGFYKENYEILGKQMTLYEFACHCRNNENMCGSKGAMYEYNDKTYDITNLDLNEEYKELQNRCCGEVNEADEIEQLEKEISDVMLKIKKHNTRHIYKTTQDLYKLFKRTKDLQT